MIENRTNIRKDEKKECCMIGMNISINLQKSMVHDGQYQIKNGKSIEHRIKKNMHKRGYNVKQPQKKKLKKNLPKETS